MFRYINMPKLVAFYLKEFSVRTDGTPSSLYKFIFCLCLPFVSDTFNRARMIALGISECTTSRDQIARLLNKITGAEVTFEDYTGEFLCGYDGTQDATTEQFIYAPSYDVVSFDNPIVPYYPVPNAGNVVVNLNGYAQRQFESYLSLLIPFYASFKISYI